MKTALFNNFTDTEFIGYWDGKGKKFAPGVSVYMPDYLARHFAKHLVNRELLRTDAAGNLIYKDGDKMTSPKKPEDVPIYMELFNKAFIPDDMEEMGDKKDDIDTLISVANKNRGKTVDTQNVAGQNENARVARPSAPSTEQDPNEPQYIEGPTDDEDEEDSFEGKPKE